MFTDIAYAAEQAAQPTAQAAEGNPSSTINIVMMAAVFFIFYFLLIKPQQKRMKEHKLFIDSLKKGDDVITTGGMLGKIVGITDKVVTLEIADKIKIKVLKTSISGIQKDTNSVE